MVAKMKFFTKKYGVPFLVYWTLLYFGCMGAVYVGLEMDVVSWGRILEFLRWLQFPGYMVDLDALNPTYGRLAVAVALNELLEVVRFPFMIVTLKRVLRLLGRA